MEEKKTYLKKMAEYLENLDTKIAEFKARAAKTGEETLGDIDKLAGELSTKQREAQQKLQELKEAGAEKWESLKGRAEKAREDVENTLGKIASKFKK